MIRDGLVAALVAIAGALIMVSGASAQTTVKAAACGKRRRASRFQPTR